MEIKDKTLFLKYAIPCSRTLIKRGWVKKEIIDELMECVKNNKEIKHDLRNIFTVAFSICSLIAKKHGKTVIDASVIRDYFWNEHDYMVNERFNEFKDFNPEKCKVYPGKVLEINQKASIITPIGTDSYRIDFVDVLKKGDYVIVHYDFIVERIDKKIAEVLWNKFNLPKIK